MPSVVLGAVSLFPSEPSAATRRSARNRTAGGVQASLCVRGVPRFQLGAAACVPSAHQKDVALGYRHALVVLGAREVLMEDVLAGLQPRHTPQSGHIEQHAAADEPV